MANMIGNSKWDQYWDKLPIANLAKVLFIISPALILAYLIISNWVNVPVHDQWAIARLILKQSDNSLVLEDLTKPYFEHRMFIPRLIILPLAFLTNWDVRYEMVVTYAIACLNALLIYRLAKITTNPKYLLWAVLCANLLIFSPVQWENWLMGMFFKYLIPTTCITAAYLICLSKLRFSTKVIFSALLATISSFSIANGLLSWLVIFPVLFENLKQLKSNIKLVFAWWIGFGITLICYFWDYRSPSEAYSPSLLLTHIFDIPFFLSTLIGAPLFASFQNSAPGLAVIGGLILTVTFIITALGLFPYQKLRVWAMLGSYSLFSALLITAGRIAVGIDQAFVSRYTPFAIPMVLSLIFLWTHSAKISENESKKITKIVDLKKWKSNRIVNYNINPMEWNDQDNDQDRELTIKPNAEYEDRSEWRKDIAKRNPELADLYDNTEQMFREMFWNSRYYLQKNDPDLVKFQNRFYRFLFLIVLSLSVISIFNMGSKMSQLKTERLEGKACLTWMIEVRNEECLLTKVVAKLSVLDQRAQKLSDLGFLRPPLRNNPILIDSSIADKDYGWVDQFDRDPNGGYLISGWAVLAERPADAIILSYINSKGEAIAFKLIDQKSPRPDVTKAMRNSAYLNSGWSTKFESSDIVETNPQIQAWGYDAETGKSYRLRGR